MYKNINFILLSQKLFVFIIIFLFFAPFASYIYANEYNIKSNNHLDDTLINKQSIDTLKYEKPKQSNKNQIEKPITYNALDSILFDFTDEKIYLYGKAGLIYEGANIEAEHINIEAQKNEIFAYGAKDSIGKTFGKPIFKEGEEEIKADSIRYNFKSKKGIIKEVTTEFEGSYLHGAKTKMYPNKHIHLINGKFTSCDLEHPHYYFSITKAKMIPDDKIVSGPVYLVIEDVPTPLGLPFGFFPNKKGGNSGIILPEFGQEESRGYFLRNLAYYWAINDKFDLTLLGDIYTKGSWGIGVNTNYKLRYKFNGYLNFKYNKNITGYADINQSKTTLYSFKWRFIQDQKANPTSNFAADVNISSSKYDRYYSYNINNILQTNKQSSISYSKVFANSPFSLTAAIRHNQNNTNSIVNLILPEISLNMNRIYPFKRKVKLGETKFYEKIGLAYNLNLINQIKTNEENLFKINFDSLNNGISHRIPISTSFKFLKYTTISPSFNYNEKWYFKYLERTWAYDNSQDSIGHIENIFKSKFNRVWDYNFAVNWNTQIYGTFNFVKGKIKAIRHVISPSLSFNYLPDFGKEKYKYYDKYNRILYNSNTGQYDTINYYYSRYETSVYGTPTRGGAGSISLNLNNTLEMKVRNTKDSTSSDTKIKLLESLNISANYNIMADSLNLSPISISGRTRIKFFDINFYTMLDPYAIIKNPYNNKAAYRINTFAYKINKQLVRMTSANISIGFSLNSKNDENKNNKTNNYSDKEYIDFKLPWNISFNYAFRYDKPYFETNITQTINLTGEFKVTNKWKVVVHSGYDIMNKQITPTTIDIYRDLHCWEASLHIVPFGMLKSYAFQINVKASMLQDLKLAKRRNWQDNFNYQ